MSSQWVKSMRFKIHAVCGLTIDNRMSFVIIGGMENTHKTSSDPKALLSLRSAARELGVNSTWLSGHLAALKVKLTPIGRTLAVSRHDLKRVQIPVKVTERETIPPLQANQEYVSITET